MGLYTGRRMDALLKQIAEKGMSAIFQDSALFLSLLDQMAEDDGTPALHFAASCGNTAKVETLITQEGKDVIQRCPYRQRTPLHYAARHGKVETTRTLLQLKAEVEAQDDSGARPMHLAAMFGMVEVVKTLAQCGAELEGEDKATGARPLHLAAEQDQVETIRTLVQLGAEIDALCSKDRGRTPLHCAAMAGKSEAIRMLAQLGADLEAKAGGATAIQFAVAVGHVEATRTLVELGAETDLDGFGLLT